MATTMNRQLANGHVQLRWPDRPVRPEADDPVVCRVWDSEGGWEFRGNLKFEGKRWVGRDTYPPNVASMLTGIIRDLGYEV